MTSSGTDYSLLWRGINVWKCSQCWSQYIFLLLASISPSAEDSCPWANTWLLKPCAGIRHSPITRACNGSNHCLSAPCFKEEKGLHHINRRKNKKVSPLSRDRKVNDTQQSGFLQTSHTLDKGSRSVPGPSQSATNPLSLFVPRCFCKRDTQSSSLYQGCGLSGEKDTSGIRRGNRFQSLHLTRDMLDINLAGWHQNTMWDLILWKVHHKSWWKQMS